MLPLRRNIQMGTRMKLNSMAGIVWRRVSA